MTATSQCLKQGLELELNVALKKKDYGEAARIQRLLQVGVDGMAHTDTRENVIGLTRLVSAVCQ